MLAIPPAKVYILACWAHWSRETPGQSTLPSWYRLYRHPAGASATDRQLGHLSLQRADKQRRTALRAFPAHSLRHAAARCEMSVTQENIYQALGRWPGHGQFAQCPACAQHGSYGSANHRRPESLFRKKRCGANGQPYTTRRHRHDSDMRRGAAALDHRRAGHDHRFDGARHDPAAPHRRGTERTRDNRARRSAHRIFTAASAQLPFSTNCCCSSPWVMVYKPAIRRISCVYARMVLGLDNGLIYGLKQ